jgi:hypothetical protein
MIDNNLNFLCKNIITDEYAKNLPSSFNSDSFDLDSESDMDRIFTLIREIVDKAIFLICLKNKKSDVHSDLFEYKLTRSEKNVQDEINKSYDNDPHLEELISNFISKDIEKDNSNTAINNNIIQNFVENFFVKENRKQNLSNSFRATLENIVINNILSSILQSNYSEYIYKFDIDPDKLNNVLRNYDNYSVSSRSLKITDDEFNTE